jgi:hypothetical protein
MAIDIEKLANMGSMAATGGYAQAALGGAQAIYGLTQLPKAKAEFERAQAAAPSLETPAQFYENYKNAYDSALASMQNDAIQANLATSVQALQGAGGRALVGGLGAATAQAQASQNQMLAQERQMRMSAGQQLAAAQERSIGRKEARSQQEIAYANQAYQAALGNIGSGLASAGEGLMYGLSSAQGGKGNSNRQVKEEQKSESTPSADMSFVEESRGLLAEESKPEVLKTPDLNLPDPTGMFMKNKPLNQNAKMPNLQYIEPFGISEEPEKGPFDTLPVNQMRVPQAYQNEQAIKQLNALSKVYNQFYPAANTLFKQGGMMTKGAFNHDTNPIDLVQDGQKVGEATGGEYILNPTQAKAIAKQSSYAKKLFRKFEKNAKKKK